MKTIILKSDRSNYTISEYQFKLISGEASDEQKVSHDGLMPKNSQTCKVKSEANLNKSLDEFVPLDIKRINSEKRESDEKSHTEVVQNRDDLVESLLKKTDELSSELIKAQMSLEDHLSSQKMMIEAIKKESFDEALIKAKQEMIKLKESETNTALEQLNRSILKLEKTNEEFEKTLNTINSELLNAALDIAKEVISMEISTKSATIATKLINDITDELQGASKITLKVNPEDFIKIKASVGELKNIEILSDEAIALGGVVAMSDIGNIDSDLKKRYERVKSTILHN